MNATSNQAMTSQAGASPLANPWVQLIIGIICMVMIANMQYGWTLFVGPIGAKYHWSKAAIQVAFTIFVLVIAAAEASLALGLVVLLFRQKNTLDANAWRELKG